MALEFTEIGKQLILWNMFGNSASTATTYGRALSDTDISLPSLGGSAYESVGDSLCIHFYAGTRPDIENMSRDWQGTAYSGSTKLYPIGSSFGSVSGILAASSSNTFTNPKTKLTVDWTENSITNTSSPLISNAFFSSGTISWFAVYAGLGEQGKANGSGWKLAFTGSVGLAGSGEDIEMNRLDVPSSSYPINVNTLTFQFPQSVIQDVVFSKNIHTTALANIFGAGIHSWVNGGVSYQIFNLMKAAADANTKYVWNGTNVNRIQLYSGTRPPTPDDAVPAGNVLVANIDTFAMAWSNMTQTTTSSEVSLAKSGTWVGSSLAAENPNWARILVTNSGTTASIDCSAGLATGNSVIKYQDPVTQVGQSINIISVKFAIA